MYDEEYMRLALNEAQKAIDRDEVPIGCVIVHNDKIISSASNRIEELQLPTAHAEILAINEAASSLGSRRLLDCTLYVTLEPCPMCAGAIVNSRIPRIVFGSHDPKAGASETLFTITNDFRLNHRCEVVSGILAEESSRLLTEFFKKLRKKN